MPCPVHRFIGGSFHKIRAPRFSSRESITPVYLLDCPWLSQVSKHYRYSLCFGYLSSDILRTHAPKLILGEAPQLPMSYFYFDAFMPNSLKELPVSSPKTSHKGEASPV